MIVNNISYSWHIWTIYVYDRKSSVYEMPSTRHWCVLLPSRATLTRYRNSSLPWVVAHIILSPLEFRKTFVKFLVYCTFQEHCTFWCILHQQMNRRTLPQHGTHIPRTTAHRSWVIIHSDHRTWIFFVWV